MQKVEILKLRLTLLSKCLVTRAWVFSFLTSFILITIGHSAFAQSVRVLDGVKTPDWNQILLFRGVETRTLVPDLREIAASSVAGMPGSYGIYFGERAHPNYSFLLNSIHPYEVYGPTTYVLESQIESFFLSLSTELRRPVSHTDFTCDRRSSYILREGAYCRIDLSRYLSLSEIRNGEMFARVFNRNSITATVPVFDSQFLRENSNLSRRLGLWNLEGASGRIDLTQTNEENLRSILPRFLRQHLLRWDASRFDECSTVAALGAHPELDHLALGPYGSPDLLSGESPEARTLVEQGVMNVSGAVLPSLYEETEQLSTGTLLSFRPSHERRPGFHIATVLGAIMERRQGVDTLVDYLVIEKYMPGFLPITISRLSELMQRIDHDHNGNDEVIARNPVRVDFSGVINADPPLRSTIESRLEGNWIGDRCHEEAGHSTKTVLVVRDSAMGVASVQYENSTCFGTGSFRLENMERGIPFYLSGGERGFQVTFLESISRLRTLRVDLRRDSIDFEQSLWFANGNTHFERYE